MFIPLNTLVMIAAAVVLLIVLLTILFFKNRKLKAIIDDLTLVKRNPQKDKQSNLLEEEEISFIQEVIAESSD